MFASFINYLRFHWNMPTGLKQSSGQIEVSFEQLSVPGGFGQKRIDLQLNALDNEVFVVTGVKLDLTTPQSNLTGVAANIDASTFAALTTQPTSVMPTLADSTCFATASEKFRILEEIQAGGGYAVAFGAIENAVDTPHSMDYLAIIATPNFYVSTDGSSGNTNSNQVRGKLYGYRAAASSSIYASLVQSELLSS